MNGGMNLKFSKGSDEKNRRESQEKEKEIQSFWDNKITSMSICLYATTKLPLPRTEVSPPFSSILFP